MAKIRGYDVFPGKKKMGQDRRGQAQDKCLRYKFLRFGGKSGRLDVPDKSARGAG